MINTKSTNKEFHGYPGNGTILCDNDVRSLITESNLLVYLVKQKKLSAVVVTLCLSFLLLTQCSKTEPSLISVRPEKAPNGVILESVTINGLDADFFHGTSTKPQMALVLLGGSEGGRYWSYHPEFIQELIKHGFCVLSLPYFGTDNLPINLRSIPLEYFSKAFHWLSLQEKQVIPNDYGLVGVSRGAELALLLGSRYPEVKGIVAIDPSSVVFPGPPTGFLDALRGQHSASSENGKELSFVTVPFSWTTIRGMISGKRTSMFEKALKNTQRVKMSEIPVEKIQGPILLVSFTHDQVWPSTLMSEQIMNRLHENNFLFHYEHVAYDGGHSEWSVEPRRTKILTFLREQLLNPISK
jgi:pimeloyl-ACP methyl ester carboxylesterase